jgi:p-hydroxybenzoate 3-monooxygenase
MRVQVAIIGSGPAGLLLGKLLADHGIAVALVDRSSRDHILGRVRAGVLEEGTVGLMRAAGCAARLEAEGLPHEGIALAYHGSCTRIDLQSLTGRHVTVYGQTELTHDLMDAHAALGTPGFYGAEDAAPHGFDGDHPHVTFRHEGREHRLDADFIVGAGGYHGPSRRAIPAGARSEFERVYPFGWLGVLADVPPCSDELVYATCARGFALCSMRSAQRSRYYVQVPLETKVADWPDKAFWDELRRRLPDEVAAAVTTGPSFEKSVAPLRSFVAEPMRFGRLFLAGDAAHIVPPTGAKGLNLAASDVHYLFEGLREHYRDGSSAGLDAYSGRALARVWKSVRFSWWMTTMLHRFPDEDPLAERLRRAELDYLIGSGPAQGALAENYVGLPF